MSKIHVSKIEQLAKLFYRLHPFIYYCESNLDWNNFRWFLTKKSKPFEDFCIKLFVE